MKITKSINQSRVETLNKMTKNPIEYMTQLKNGEHKTNLGHYSIDRCLGSVKLVQTMNSGGGVRIVFYASTEREFFDKIITINNFISYDLKSFTPEKIK
tara:strand:+ start:1965 stop:2261 length:297 start_codon:yes stop_codon:yes gene_type:complete